MFSVFSCGPEENNLVVTGLDFLRNGWLAGIGESYQIV